MKFGLDADSHQQQEAAGLTPDYQVLWVGVWNLQKGWRDTDAQLRRLHEANLTPAIQFYYWGDDMAPSCLQQSGCAGKDLAGWTRLRQELAHHLQTNLHGDPVLVVLETEFNKGSVAHLESLDEALALQATELKRSYPGATVVLGLGAWNPSAWGTWDRAAAASDAIGLQALQGFPATVPGTAPGTTAPGTAAGTLFNATVAHARTARAVFGLDVVLDDVAVASASGPAGAEAQRRDLAAFVAGMPALHEAGVTTMLYRAYVDNPSMGLDNYFGEAERHFGLATVSGELKPAGQLWVQAIQAQRAAASGPTAG